MSVLANLVVRMSADTSALEKGLKGAKGHMSKLSGIMKTGALAGGAALAGLGVASVKLGIDFEKSMAEVKTLLPDISEKAFGKMKDDVLKFSAEMGIATDKAVPALYQAISAGIPKENVMEFMEVASKAAIGGVTELETAVDGITSVVNAYGSDVLSAGKASDLMFTAVRLGKTDFDQLSKSLFNVVPTAASLGIGLDEIAASLAVMTAQGVPTSVATTGLRQAFVEASKGGTKLDEAIKKLSGGQGLGALVAEGSSASSIFEALRQSMPEQDFKDLFGSVEAMNAVLQITGPNADKMAAAMTEMGVSTGATDKAFDTMAATASFKLGKAINQLKVGLTILGGKALPVLIKGFEEVTTFIQGKLIPAFKDWWQKQGPGVTKFLQDTASLLRSLFVPALDTLRDAWVSIAPVLEQHVLPALKKVGQFLIEHKPLLIAIAAVILTLVSPWLAVAAAIVIVLAKWDEISQFFSVDVPNAIDKFLDKIGEIPIIGEIFKGTFEAIKTIVFTAWDLIKNRVETAINAIRDIITIVTALIHGDWEEAWQGVKDLVSGIWGGIKEEIELVLGGIKDLLGIYAETFLGVIKDGWGLVKDFFTTTIPDFFKNEWKNILLGVFGGIPLLLMVKFRDKLVEAIANVSASLLKGGQDVAAWIASGLMLILDKAYEFGRQIPSLLWEGLLSMKDWLLGELGGFVDSIIGKLNPLNWDIPGLSPFQVAFRHAGQMMIRQLVVGARSEMPKVAQVLEELGGLAASAVLPLPAVADMERYIAGWKAALRGIYAESGEDAAITYADQLAEILPDRWDTIVIPRIKSLFRQLGITGWDAAAEAGEEGGEGLTSGLADEIDRLTPATSLNIAHSLRVGLASFSTEAVEWGKSIAGYIQSGIFKGFHDNFASYARGIADIIYDELKAALGASSPAKALIPLGEAAAQGYSLGFQGALAPAYAPTAALAAPTVAGGGSVVHHHHSHFDGPLMGDRRQLEDLARRLDPYLQRRRR